jgi:nucleotide-binding universal stress UspA family protein
MPSFSSIVVGTDGSATANIAVEHAMQLASESGAKLSIVCAFDADSSRRAEGEPIADSPADAAAASILQRAVKQATSLGLRDVDTFDIAGDPADAIVDVAERISADLIVVGNKGMTGARRLLLGSVPNNVSHHAPCSVLIVRTS